MSQISKYNFILFVVPLITVLLSGYFLDAYPKGNIIVKFMDIITEKDMSELLKRNGTNETWVKRFPYIRLLVSLLFGLVTLIGKKTWTQFFISIGILIAMYKFIYVYMLIVDADRVKKLNRELPYLMKTIIYLMQPYNPHDAIAKAYEYVDSTFKYDLKILSEETFKMPRSFEPYQNFINRYDGKIKNLDRYLKSIYRLSTSVSSSDVSKYMTTLNETISDAVQKARAEKNKEQNDIISYLGFIPVILSTIMVCYMMILSVTAMY